MTQKQRSNLARALVFLLVILGSVYIFSIRDQAKALAGFGYPGIFLLSILSNATIFLPAPGIVFVFTMGAVFNPFWVAIAAGAGAAIGELAGYLIGYSGRGVVENAETYSKLLNWMRAHPQLSNLLVMGLAFIPNPLFDLAGIAAGSLRIPVYNFLLFTFIGKTLKMLILAYAGSTSLNLIFKK